MSEPGGGQSRRGWLGGAAAVVGAVVVTGCGGSSGSAKTDSTAGQTGTTANKNASPRDVELLAAALELERRTVNAYVASVPLLSKPESQAAAGWLSAELEHTGELIGLIGQAGGKAPPRADSYEIGPMPSDQAQTLALLAGLEQLQIAHYLTIIPELELATARAAVSSILASDAQHLALLRYAQGKPPVPSAFLT